MKKYRLFLKQIILFALVGVGSLLVDVGVTTALYQWAHIPAGAAGAVGFCSAFFFNFPINRKHVFNHTINDKFSLKTQVMLYASLSLINLGITVVMMQFLVNSVGLQVSIAKVCITGLIAIWNFFIFRFFVFAKHAPAAEIEALIVQ